jgi:hypothetical protein
MSIYNAALNVVARHLPFAVVLVAGATLRTFVVFAYQPVLMLQRDTYAYLEMAAGKGQVDFRAPLYPLLLKPAVALGNLTVVAVFQHLVGLAVGLAIYVLLRRLGAGRWAGALGAAPVLLDAYQIDLEHYLLTEALFQLLLMGAVFLLVWWARPSPVAVAVAGLLLALSAATRFIGLVLIVPALVYVLWVRMGWLRVAALCAGFGVTTIVYSLLVGNAVAGAHSARGGFFLYGRVASFADCQAVVVPQELRRFCIDRLPAENDLSGGIFTLGLPMKELRADPNANAKLLEFSFRMIAGRPSAYIRTVLADLWRYVEPVPPPGKESYVDRWLFVSSPEEAHPNPYVASRGGSPPRELGITQTFRINRRIASWLRSYQRVGYLWGPVLGLCVLLGAVGSLAGARETERDLRPVSGLFAFAALAMLLGAVMTTVYHFRYVIAPLPLIGPSGVLGAGLLWERLVARKGGRRSAGQKPSRGAPKRPAFVRHKAESH